LVFPPGEHFDYTNLGFAVLGEVVARAAGKSFGAALRDEVFAPLGMRDASLGPNPARANTALRYSRARGAHASAASGSPGASAGYASVHDLAQLALLHLEALPASRRRL